MLLFAGVAFSQQVTYQVLENNPAKAYSKYIAPEFGMEFNSSNFSLSLGSTARYALTDLITLEGAGRLDVLQMEGKGLGFLLEAGGYLPLTTKQKVKEAAVVLSYNPTAGTTWQNGQQYRVEETKYIKIPDALFENHVGVRGGLYTRKSGTSDFSETLSSSIMLTGVYLGGQFTSQAYVKTRINNDVERIGAGFTRAYFDFLVLPITELKDPAANDGVKADGLIGWRLGMQWYVSPHDGDYKFLANSIFGTEIGKRPLTGFLFNLTWGFAFMNGR